ncbi:hypothetical protein [Parasphingorhabdus pacifica]
MSMLRTAIAVAIGYVLGRTRRMKLAITVAGMLAGRRLSLDPKQLLQQGSKLLDSSPELQQLKNKVTGELGEQLLRAAVNVATSAATNRVDAMADKIRGGSATETAEAAGTAGKEAAEKATGTVTENAPTGTSRSSRSAEPESSGEDEYAAEERGESSYAEQDSDEDEERAEQDEDVDEQPTEESSQAGGRKAPPQRQTERASSSRRPRRPRRPESPGKGSEQRSPRTGR